MKKSDVNMAALSGYFVGRHDEIVALIKALVETESPSGDEAGSKAVVSLLANNAGTIGGVKLEVLPVNNYGEHLRLTAFSDAPESGPIVLLGHTDTVHARGSIVERPWRVEGGKAYGPGVFDMKANCVLALDVIRALAHVGIQPKRPVVLLLTCDEETGSASGRSLVEEEARKASSVNVGVFHGGRLSNVVPAEARAEIDVRFTTAAEAELIENEIFKLRPFDDRVQLTLTGGINRPPLERSEKVIALYERARAIAGMLDFELGETQVGGGSDGNFAAAVGAAVLDGLGIAGDGAHATQEHIILDDIPRRGALIAGLIASL